MRSIQRALTFIDEASRAAEMAALDALMRRAFDDYGVRHYALLGFAMSEGGRTPVLLNTPVNLAWSEHYKEQGYYNVDAVMHAILKRPQGAEWAEVELRPLPRASRDLFGECRSELKVDGGIALPTYDASGFAGAIGMYYEGEPDAEMKRALKLIGHFAMERAKELRGLVVGEEPAPCPLTVQQREILALSAHGKTDWEMGRLTGLSHKTINHHLERAKGLIGVRTRAQAVALAVQRGWIAIG
ncbi:MAG: autoinducer binding domain-containing protein [Pseudomonadota bacterium]